MKKSGGKTLQEWIDIAIANIPVSPEWEEVKIGLEKLKKSPDINLWNEIQNLRRSLTKIAEGQEYTTRQVNFDMATNNISAIMEEIRS